MTIEKDVPETIIMDDNRLQQILTNFVGNACKFAPDSLIHLKVYMANNQPFEEIIFCLEDAGPGIALENLCSIFEPYNQVESDLNRKTNGVGLGLSICKHLSEAMGGRCEAHSKLGEGSRFYLRLPCNTKQLKSQINEHRGKSNAEDLVKSKQKDSLQIMLVDDSEINHMIASKMLKNSGHQVISVMSGEDAIDVSITKRFDVILMDLQMPGMDGISTARKIIETNGINSNTPIIPMTANVGSEFEVQTADAGMTGFIAKPINPDIMLDSIYLALKESNV
jgi:CheY-like chemotaxis protein